MKRTHFSKQEMYFAFGTLVYATICILFAVLFHRGTEVEWIATNYSETTNSVFAIITQLAELPGIFIFIVVVLIKQKRQLFHFSLIALSTFAIISICKHFLFEHTDRPRAWAVTQQMQLPQQASDLMHFSFPSGHTAFAFCLMYCLATLFDSKNWTVFFLCIGIMVGLSRIYLLAHFVIDTGIGALIGCLIGIVGNRLYTVYVVPRLQKR